MTRISLLCTVFFLAACSPANAEELKNSRIPAGAVGQPVGNGISGTVQYFKLAGKTVGVRYYDKDGILESEELLVPDTLGGGSIREGVCTEYYPDGTIYSEGTYHDGLKDGEWRYYDATGKLRRESKLVNRTGVIVRYSKHPQCANERWEVQYKDGFVDGLEILYFLSPKGDEVLCGAYRYEKGTPIGWIVTRDSQGRLVETEYFTKGSTADGVKRRFVEGNKLAAGYPEYQLGGVKTTKEKYLEAMKKQPELQVPFDYDGRNELPDIKGEPVQPLTPNLIPPKAPTKKK